MGYTKMPRRKGGRNGRRMGRVNTPVTEEQRREQAQAEWEVMLSGTQTERLRVLRRAMFNAGADHTMFARSAFYGMQKGEAAWGRLWLETLGFVKAEDLQQYTVLVIERVCEVVRPFIPADKLPELMGALTEQIGGNR
jgi:hypothetical protein